MSESEKAPGRGYVPPPPLDQKVVVGPCGAWSSPTGYFKCKLAKGHEGAHEDQDGDPFLRGYVPGNAAAVGKSTLPVFDYSHELPDNATVVRTDVNDYKQDAGKPPLMQAVFVPFGKTLLALAAMMEDMKHKHKLEGAKDPFQKWRQLPNAKWRLANAGARHATTPFQVNTKDGKHLQIVHAIWGLMAAYEKHLEETQS